MPGIMCPIAPAYTAPLKAGQTDRLRGYGRADEIFIIPDAHRAKD